MTTKIKSGPVSTPYNPRLSKKDAAGLSEAVSMLLSKFGYWWILAELQACLQEEIAVAFHRNTRTVEMEDALTSLTEATCDIACIDFKEVQ